jgi:hypothetical protein
MLLPCVCGVCCVRVLLCTVYVLKKRGGHDREEEGRR